MHNFFWIFSSRARISSRQLRCSVNLSSSALSSGKDPYFSQGGKTILILAWQIKIKKGSCLWNLPRSALIHIFYTVNWGDLPMSGVLLQSTVFWITNCSSLRRNTVITSYFFKSESREPDESNHIQWSMVVFINKLKKKRGRRFRFTCWNFLLFRFL